MDAQTANTARIVLNAMPASTVEAVVIVNYVWRVMTANTVWIVKTVKDVLHADIAPLPLMLKWQICKLGEFTK